MFVRAITCLLAISQAIVARAQVVEFIDREDWQNKVGDYTTIDFTGFPNHTFITDQYSDLGVMFMTTNYTAGPTPLFPDDTWGLIGPNGIRFQFDSPQHWVGVDYPGAVRFQLFHEGMLIYTSSYFQPSGAGHFAGLISELAFDEVYLHKRSADPNVVGIDNLHWGAPVPAPSPLIVLAAAVLGTQSRRRRR